jgi:hypothetical protein
MQQGLGFKDIPSAGLVHFIMFRRFPGKILPFPVILRKFRRVRFTHHHTRLWYVGRTLGLLFSRIAADGFGV